MNKKIVFSLIVLVFFGTLSAQKNDPVVLKINGNPVTKSEFEYIYHKNSSAGETDKKSLDDYLNLFVNYKLKVEEAKFLKMDTVASFLKEYSGYKAQLADPYLQDTISELALAKKYYDRLGENLEVSHILIPFTQKKMLPADTLDAYNKALDVWKKVTDASHPIPFEKAAAEFSSDHSGKRPGYLGWVTANMLVAPFENAIYNMKAGSISLPIRTNFGYHIILLHSRRPDIGESRVAHIMFATNVQMTPKQVDSVYSQAEIIYQKLVAGGDYAQLAKEYSFDKYSSEHSGEIGWVKVGARFPSEWLEASFSLKEVNDFTKPIKTDYGYHIIKLLEKKPREPFTALKSQIMNYVKNGDHKKELDALKIAKLKTDIKPEVNLKAYLALLGLSNTEFPCDSAFLAHAQKIKQPFLKVDKNTYTTDDFVEFLKIEKPRTTAVSTEYFTDRFNSFLLTKLNHAKEQSLSSKYPEFKNLSNEYFDGILLFDIMNREVWQKAEKDTAGLEKYFADNKAKYTWGQPKHKGYVIHCKDKSVLNKAKEIVAQNKGKNNLPQLLSSLNDSIGRVTIEVGTWGEGDNAYVDKEFYGKENKKEMKAYPLYFIEARSITAPEDYIDVKGQIVSDYQDYLEKIWVESLHKKYKVEVNKKVLGTVK
ncbi:MAG: PpiC-type peptidyl-prolyl cis-trans isomerase [Bacteroidetes bacterium]|nr:PpiC-type peptidyl-prolyl cis-trans isomerase [Bacteroidota bacterium]